MDFFSAQDQARQKTRYLVILFVLNALFVAGGIFVLLGFLQLHFLEEAPQTDVWSVQRFLLIFAIALLIMGTAAFAKVMQYRKGGGTVARALGGKLVSPQTTDLHEKRLLNVVEEMAIAAGVPVPEVYLLGEEKGINAFAAGNNIRDAAIGVTRGCVESLSRDELQGVIAHEFSHILNGDMRINLRLAGILFGIMFVALIGRGILRSSLFMRPRGRSSKDNSGAVLVFVGIAFLILGVIGEWIGRLIQAAISRQREFLADAAAVQYTRNPQGISGALKRIGAGSQHGRMETAAASGFAHMFFASCLKSSLGGALATHPPLPTRIRRIEPGWDGEWKTGKPSFVAKSTEKSKKTSSARPFDGLQGLAGMAVLAGEQMSGISPALLESAHQPGEASDLLLTFVLDPNVEQREKQFAEIARRHTTARSDAVRRLFPALTTLRTEDRIPVLEILLGTLRTLTEKEKQELLATMDALCQMDDIIHLREALVQVMARHWLSEKGSSGAGGDCGKDAATSVVLLAIAQLELGETPAAMQVAQSAAQQAGLKFDQKTDTATVGSRIEAAVQQLRSEPYALRGKLLSAVHAVILHDQKMSAEETNWIKVLALALEIPASVINAGLQGAAVEVE